MQAIHKLLSVPNTTRDDAWLAEALQEAVELEFSTIPPYLYALWSIDSNNDPDQAAKTISTIVQEEMLHMGLACNLLAGIGVKPQLAGKAPTYPGHLKAGIHANLVVGLAPLSKGLLLNAFMAIEEPAQIVAEDNAFQPSHSTLISTFYNEIKSYIQANQTPFTPAAQIDLSQVLFPGAPGPVSGAAGGASVIDFILKQGEGALGTPFEDGDNDLAHFYRFGELYHGKRLSKTPPYAYNGAPVAMPAVFNLPENPANTPDHQVFNAHYSSMLRDLETAWATANSGMLSTTVFTTMLALKADAQSLINDKNTGPTFVYISDGSEQANASSQTNTAAYDAIIKILDDAVNNADIGKHGRFWKGLTRDEFVAANVYGYPIISIGKPADSNLVKALRGIPPFGSDAGVSGATFRRMPAGMPPVADNDIKTIEDWISSGCPASNNPPASTAAFSLATGASVSPEQHNAFWRDFDNWAMFNATSDVKQAEGAVFGFVGSWFAYARDNTKKPAWLSAIQQPKTEAALRVLADKQRQTIESHYGSPVPLLALLDSFHLFGADQLPTDPLRPADVHHRMDGTTMWFVWAAFANAVIGIGFETDFWLSASRCILCGLLNDGLIRGRFTVQGFENSMQGQIAIIAFVQQLSDDAVMQELQKRYIQSGL